MFLGHVALGLAAKRPVPRVSLGVLILAAQFADVAWPLLVAVGAEQVAIDPGNTAVTPLNFISYPYSHSLLMLVVWGVVFGGAYYAATRGDIVSFAVLDALVVSHWILDVATHAPDMPIYPGNSPKFGFGLWNSVPATLAIESTMFAAAVWVYARSTRARDAIGRWAFIGLVALLAVSYVANVLGGAPPSVAAIWIAGLIGGGLILALAAWSDRHRDPLVNSANPAKRVSARSRNPLRL